MGKPAARMGDATTTGGPIVQGSMGVLIGSPNGIACSVCPGGMAVGNPVNPMLGAKVLSNEKDISLPGVMSFSLSRSYNSYQTDTPGPVGLLGPGWQIGLDVSLLIDENILILNEESGRSIYFDKLNEGEATYSTTENIWLIRGGAGDFAEDHALSILWKSLPTSLKNNPRFYFIANNSMGPIWLLGYNDPYIPLPSDTLPPDLPKRRTLQGIYNRFGQGVRIVHETQGEFTNQVKLVIDGVGRHYRFELIRITNKLKSNIKQGWGDDSGVRLSAIYLVKDPCYPELPKKPLIRYEYSQRGELYKVYDKGGIAIRQFNYHPEYIGYMTAHQHIGRPPTKYSYDQYRRVIRQTNEGGLDYTFTYKDDQTVVTDSMGRQNIYYFAGEKGLKRLVKHQRPDGSIIENCYDKSGRLIAVTNPAGQVTELDLDIVTGNLLAITTPDGKTSRYSYNTRGQIQETINFAGVRIKTQYDLLGRVTSYSDENGGINNIYYADDQSDLIASIEDAAGAKKSLQWTAYGLLEKYTDCSGKEIHYLYNRDGKVLHINMEEGLSNTYDYDERGRLISETNTANEFSSYEYNDAGDIVKMNQTDGSVISLYYDDWGNLISRKHGKTSQQFYYDEAGRMNTVVNENGVMTLFVYDAMDRLIKETGFDGRTKSYSYDALSQVKMIQDGRLISRYRYNLSNNLVEVETLESDEVVDKQTWFYNQYNQVKEVTSQSRAYNITVCFERDKFGRIVKETQRIRDKIGQQVWQHQIKHAYQIQGLRTETIPDGLSSLKWLTYGSGHLLGLSYDGNELIEFERDNLHREKILRFGQSQKQHLYDSAGRLIQSDFSQIKGLHQQSQYYYDVTGHIIEITQGDKRNQYRYDDVGRLTEVLNSNYQQYYRYDPAGNRIISDNRKGKFLPSDVQFNSNQVPYDEHYEYDYDYYGNMISKTSRHKSDEIHYFQYDMHHRLTHYQQIKKGEITAEATYLYDAFSRRIQKQVNYGDSKQITWYGWDGDNLVLMEKGIQRIHTVYYPDSFVPLLRIECNIPDINPSLGDVVEQALNIPLNEEIKNQLNELEPRLKNNTLTNSQLVWLQQAQLTQQQLSQFIKTTRSTNLSEHSITLYNCNYQGTPQALVDLQGRIVWQAEYDPWGNLVDEKNFTNLYQPIRMQGQYYDKESNLHYNRYRYYDPCLGRYLTQDPIGLAGGLNIYQYANAEPVQQVDPKGLNTAIVGGAVGGTIGGPPGAVVGAAIGGIILLAGIIYVAAKSREETDSISKCNRPCPPCSPPAGQKFNKTTHTDHDHGNCLGRTGSQTHWHYAVNHQDPKTCICYTARHEYGGCGVAPP